MQVAAKLLNSSFFSSSSIIFAGSFAVNVLNYVFTLVMSRLLGVEEFGEVTALISLLLIISVPATTLTMLMAREAAGATQTGHTQAPLLTPWCWWLFCWRSLRSTEAILRPRLH